MLIESLIPPDASFWLWACLTAMAALAFWVDTTRLGRRLSGVALSLLAAMLLSNANIIPKSAPTYDTVWSYLIPLAVSLLLLKADLRRIFDEARSMLIAFMLGTLGTLAGTVIGFYILPLGDAAHQLAGVFSATYIGGSMNMVAVAEAVELDGSLMSASVAADNVVGVMYLALLATLPAVTFLRRWLPSSIISSAAEPHQASNTTQPHIVPLNLLHISLALTLGFSICALAKALSSALGIANYNILFITAISVAIANLFPKTMARLKGEHEIGLLLMYLFFVVAGASADIGKMLDSALWIMLYAVVIVVCHMLVIFGGSRFFKLDLAEVIIASNACCAGPASAVALAASQRWHTLVTPAVLLGVFGYVIANFLGVLIASVLT